MESAHAPRLPPRCKRPVWGYRLDELGKPPGARVYYAVIATGWAPEAGEGYLTGSDGERRIAAVRKTQRKPLMEAVSPRFQPATRSAAR